MNWKILGLDPVLNKYGRIQRDIRPILRQGVDRAVKYVHSQVPPYPPPPATSLYIRTGTLGREIGTEVRTMGAQVVGIIGSPTVYSPWVISDRAVGGAGPQARQHKGRWWTLQGVVDKARGRVLDILRNTIRDLIQ